MAGKKEARGFVRGYDAYHRVKLSSPKSATLVIGKEAWPFPIPIVKDAEGWVFDVAAGKEELLNRRIGRNELKVIQVMQAYVRAQYRYVLKDRDGDGILEFAQRFRSDKGKKNGLYWPVTKGEPMSPLGPLVAAAARDEYDLLKKGDRPAPYYGYYFKILTRQGKNAPGGACSYVADGNMIFGFGLLAYPSNYGVTGIMTFAVNQTGVVYQMDMGEKTGQIVNHTAGYNPEKSWRKVSRKYLR